MRQKKTLYERILRLSFIGLISSFYIFDMAAISTMGVFVIVAFIFLIHSFHKNFKLSIQLSSYHTHVLLFIVFCFLSSLWALDGREPIVRGITIMEILVCMSVVYICIMDLGSIDPLFQALLWGGIIVAIYTLSFYGFSNIRNIINTETRLGNDFVNANNLGMLMAISIVVCLYYIVNKGWKWPYTLIILPLLVLGMVQSRTAVLETITGIVIIISFHSMRKKKGYGGIIKLVFGLMVIGIVIWRVSQLQVFSGVSTRMNGLLSSFTGNGVIDNSTRVRNLYIQAGLKQFIKTPIFGIGIANSGQITAAAYGHYTYLHNNFVEMLACGGVIGFSIYYSMHLYIIRGLYIYRTRRQEYDYLCMTIIIMQLLSDYGTVSYYSKYTYFLLLIGFIQIALGSTDEKQERNANSDSVS